MGLLGKIIRDPLYQTGEPRPPADLTDPDLIISPDTRRERRLPPGQSRTRKWPVLDAYGPPQIDLSTWRFTVGGLVEHPQSFSLEALRNLPAVRVYADFHCVTRWSRLDNIWTGVATRTLAEMAGVSPNARFVKASAYDNGYTTNLPIEHFLAEDSLLAFLHDGEPIPSEHGGPVRLIVPRLYAWKSAKWVNGIRFLAEDEAGFWEQGGYHMRGDPWVGDDGERFR